MFQFVQSELLRLSAVHLHRICYCSILYTSFVGTGIELVMFGMV